MFDESFWVAAAFFLFLGLFGRRLWAFLVDRLDQRAESVRAELEEAVRLREEAQNLLAESERRQREAAREAETILNQAREEAERITGEAENRAAAQLARRTRLAEEKIARMEATAAADLQAAVIDTAIAAAAHVIATQMDENTDHTLIDQAAAELENRLAS